MGLIFGNSGCTGYFKKQLVGNDLFVFYESGPGNMLSFRQLPLDRILNFLKGKGRDSDWLLEMHRKNSLGLHRIPHKV